VRRLLERFVDETFVADLDFETLERVDGEFVDADFTRRESDVVWRVNFRGHALYLFILIEFQSTVDHSMALRFLRYVAGLYESLHANLRTTRLPAVFPILLYNGEPNWTAAVAFQDLVERSIPSDYIPQFQYYPVIEKNFSRTNLRKMRNAVAALFYFETTPVAEIEPHMRAIVDILKEEEPGLVKAFGNWLTHWAAQSHGEVDRPFRLKQALMELQEDTVASLFERTLEEAYQKKRMEGLKRGLEEGHTKGIEEGRQEGRQEGRKEGRQEGRHEAAVNTARKLLARGMEPADVADLVELSIEEVRAVQDEQR
jgi:predicted transposase/invertase (TIGR01784 family)